MRGVGQDNDSHTDHDKGSRQQPVQDHDKFIRKFPYRAWLKMSIVMSIYISSGDFRCSYRPSLEQSAAHVHTRKQQHKMGVNTNGFQMTISDICVQVNGFRNGLCLCETNRPRVSSQCIPSVAMMLQLAAEHHGRLINTRKHHFHCCRM